MTDYFALFDEHRRPWIEPETLKAKFLALSAKTHPDRSHQASDGDRLSANRDFTALNSAYNCLREPKDRLRHLLQLETGGKPADIRPVEGGLMDWHFEVGSLCKSADAVIAQNHSANSPLAKVRHFERAQEEIEKLSAMRARLDGMRVELLAEVQAMNPAWESAAAEKPLARLDEIYRLLGYLGKWTEQIQERTVQLSI
jgi:DnaJ-domain-containing protein 1